jgi:putative ABC transport system permease protein
METFWQDIRYGVRMMLKRPGFTAVVVLALALGIGANTAIFSVVNAVLLRPLPYKDSERLVVSDMSLPDFQDVKDSNHVFDEMAVWASNFYNLKGEGAGEPEQVYGAIVSPGFFTLLGAPAVGRAPTPDEAQQQLAVISHDFWRQHFQGDPAALGKTLNLSGKSYTVVGVTAPDFQFPNSRFKVWVTFGSAMAATPEQARNRQLRIFHAVARLNHGVTPEQARADVGAISERLRRQYPDTNAEVRIDFEPLYERMVGDVRPALLVLLGTVGLVLLIACANVANLLLARTTAREREIAIRTALGAGRWRVVRQLLTESVLLALAGGGVGLLLAAWLVDALPSLNPTNIPRLNAVSIDLPVMFFALAVSALTGVLFGLAPALQASKTNLNESLKEGGRGAAGYARGRKLRVGLVVVEVALSMVVLVGAGLLIKSFVRLLHVDTGFLAENLLTMNVEMSRFKEPERRAELSRQLVERIGQLPGVETVGAGTGLPPQTAQRATNFAVEGQSPEETGDNSAYFIAVSPDYFRALGTPLREGRAFGERDTKGAPGVVVINQSLARRLFPKNSAVGQRLKLVNPEQQDEWRTVVGVVGDVRYRGLDDPGDAAIYTPFAQTPFFWNYVLVRTKGDPASQAQAIRSAISSVNPELSAAGIRPMAQVVSESVAQPRFNTLLLSAFAFLALVLAAIGIYGVIAYTVTQRTHEIGVRMALGAQRGDVLKLVVGQGMMPALAGVVVGVVASLALTRIMSSLLYEVSATDPATFTGIAALLSGVALLACYFPARRATKVDPMVALRYE